MRHTRLWVGALLFAAACGGSATQGGGGDEGPTPMGPPPTRGRAPGQMRPGMYPAVPVAPPFPDSGTFGVPVLVAARAPDTALWVGTYGRGLYVARPKAKAWEQLTPRSGDSTAISFVFVNALGFTRGAIWYGTVGNGFGRSTDGGRTWRNWTGTQLGPEWQYVAPDGIRGRGDTVYIATADGLRISGDAGATWRCIRGPAPVVAPPTPVRDGCAETVTSLPDEYLLALELTPDGIWVGHLHGLSVSRDGGRTWTSATGVPPGRVRALRVNADTSLWVATENAYFRAPRGRAEFKEVKVDVPGYGAPPGAPRAFIRGMSRRAPAIATSRGLLVPEPYPDSSFHLYLGKGEIFHPAADFWTGLWDAGRILPLTGSDMGFRSLLPLTPSAWDLVDALPGSPPAAPRHAWLQRPIAADANPYIDQTYRYGSTMGGTFQQHQGVEFNDPDGTPVHAIADGTVVYSGPAEAGANTVAIRHDQGWSGQQVFSVYYHNIRLEVQRGQHVRAGDVISLVGNTGRATNDHLHLEVHVAPSADSSRIVNAAERYPPFTVNPQLWISPLPGTGVVAGRVLGVDGKPLGGARVYGLTLPYPSETPFVFAETYQDKAHPDPAYGDNFAVGDVPAGRYLVAAVIAGTPVWRVVDVAVGQLTWVEFRPATPSP